MLPRMRRRSGFTVPLLVALLVGLGSAPLAAQVLDRPVAIVRLTSTVNIGQRELRTQVELLQQQLGRELTVAERRELLDAQIGEVLLNQAAARANIRVTQEEIEQAIALQRQSLGQPVTDAQFRQIVEQQAGLTWDQYVTEIRDRLIQERFIFQEAQGRIEQVAPPTEREIRQVYEENAQQFASPAMVRFDHLFFDFRTNTAQQQQGFRERAAAMVRSIERGQETYDALLRASLDDASYAGGDFGFIVRGDASATQALGSSFINAVFDLEEGDVSGVLESSVGLHIVRITDRRAPRLLQLTDPVLPGESVTVRDQIVSFIVGQRQQEAFEAQLQRTLRRLEGEADVTRFEDNLTW